MNEATEYFKKYGIEQAKKAHAMSINLGHEDLDLKKLIEDSKGKIDKIDLEKEREAFEINWLSLGGKLDNFEYTTDQMYSLSKEASKKLSEQDKLISIMIINQLWQGWKKRAELAEDRKVYNEKDHAELVADSAIEEINRLKQEERKYKEKHGQFVGKIHALEKKLARYENPDYVLVPRKPNREIRQALESGFEFDHSESNYDANCGYEAMIEAVEKDHAEN